MTCAAVSLPNHGSTRLFILSACKHVTQLMFSIVSAQQVRLFSVCCRVSDPSSTVQCCFDSVACTGALSDETLLQRPTTPSCVVVRVVQNSVKS